MGGMSLWHWIVVAIVLLLLFGRGRFSDMMGDVAKGIKSFKKGMAEEDEVPQKPAAPAARIDATPHGQTIEGEASKSHETKL